MPKRQALGLVVLLALTAAVLLAAGGIGPSDGERADREMPEAAPVAELTGDGLSPDGRFEIRTAGESGAYISGLELPEQLEIVDRETGAVLWEDVGYATQSVLWSPDGAYLALAYGARTWGSIKLFETDAWTAWEFTLPDGKTIPEYTYFPEDAPWGVWLEDGALLVTVGVVTVWDPEAPERAFWYELQLREEDGSAIWSCGPFSTSHVGWNSLFAYQANGQDYMLQYLPYMGQGLCSYANRVFYLGENGEEIPVWENGVDFDINFGAENHQYDPPAIADFLWEVQRLLADSTLLLSTEGGTMQSAMPGHAWYMDLFGGDSREALEDAIWQKEAEWRTEQGA